MTAGEVRTENGASILDQSEYTLSICAGYLPRDAVSSDDRRRAKRRSCVRSGGRSGGCIPGLLGRAPV